MTDYRHEAEVIKTVSKDAIRFQVTHEITTVINVEGEDAHEVLAKALEYIKTVQ